VKQQISQWSLRATRGNTTTRDPKGDLKSIFSNLKSRAAHPQSLSSFVRAVICRRTVSKNTSQLDEDINFKCNGESH